MNNKDKILVLYFSKTGHSKNVADYIARLIDCDIEKIIPKRDLDRTLPMFLEVLSSSFSKASQIVPCEKPISKYENVIICCPIWCGNIPASVRGLLNHKDKRIKNLSFIFSSSKFSDEKIIRKLENQLNIKINDHLFLTNQDRLKNYNVRKVAKLIEKIKHDS